MADNEKTVHYRVIADFNNLKRAAREAQQSLRDLRKEQERNNRASREAGDIAERSGNRQEKAYRGVRSNVDHLRESQGQLNRLNRESGEIAENVARNQLQASRETLRLLRQIRTEQERSNRAAQNAGNAGVRAARNRMAAEQNTLRQTRALRDEQERAGRSARNAAREATNANREHERSVRAVNAEITALTRELRAQERAQRRLQREQGSNNNRGRGGNLRNLFSAPDNSELNAMNQAIEATERRLLQAVNESQRMREVADANRDRVTSIQEVTETTRTETHETETSSRTTDRATESSNRLGSAHRRRAGDTDRSTDATRRNNNATRQSSSIFSRASAGADRLSSGLLKVGRIRIGRDPTLFSLVGIISAILSLLNPLIAGLGAVGAAAFAVSGNIASIGGAAIAAIPGVMALVSAVAALKMAFSGVGKAFSAFNKRGRGKLPGGNDKIEKLDRADLTFEEKLARAHEVLRRAIEDVTFAQEDLNDVRREAKRRIEDLQRAVAGAATSELAARADAQLAREAYANIMADPTSTLGDKMSAQANMEEAIARIGEVMQENQRNREDLTEAEKDGVEGSREVIMANRKLHDSIDAVRDAEIAIQNVYIDAANAAIENANKTKDSADSVDDFAEAMNKLSPSARKFVDNILSMKDAATALRLSVQEKFFSEWADDVLKLNRLFPVLDNLLGQTATELGKIAKNTVDLITSDKWLRDMNLFAALNVPIIRSLGEGLVYVLDTIMDLTIAAAPAMQRLAAGFAEGAKNFSALVASGRESGGLAEYIDKSITAMAQWWRIVKNIAKTLTNYSRAAGDLGQWLTDGFENVTKQWSINAKAATQAGSPFRKYLEDIKPLLSAVGDLVGNFFSWFANVSMDPRNIKHMKDIVDTINNKLGPALARILDSFADTDIAANLVDILGNLLEVIAGFLENGGADVLSAIVKGIQGLTDVLSSLMQLPGAGYVLLGIAAGIVAIAGALKAVSLAASGINALRTLGGLRGGAAAAGGGRAATGGGATALGATSRGSTTTATTTRTGTTVVGGGGGRHADPSRPTAFGTTGTTGRHAATAASSARPATVPISQGAHALPPMAMWGQSGRNPTSSASSAATGGRHADTSRPTSFGTTGTTGRHAAGRPVTVPISQGAHALPPMAMWGQSGRNSTTAAASGGRHVDTSRPTGVGTTGTTGRHAATSAASTGGRHADTSRPTGVGTTGTTGRHAATVGSGSSVTARPAAAAASGGGRGLSSLANLGKTFAPKLVAGAGKGLLALGKVATGPIGLIASIGGSIAGGAIAANAAEGEAGAGQRVGGKMLEGAATGAGLGAAVGGFLGPVGAGIGAAVGGVAGGAIGFFSAEEEDRDKFLEDTMGMFSDFFTVNLPNFFKTMGDGLWSGLESIGDWFADGWAAAQDFLVNLPYNLGVAVGNLWNGIVAINDWVMEQGNNITEWALSLPGLIAEIWNNFWGETFPSIIDWLVGTAAALGEWAVNLPSTIASIWNNFWGKTFPSIVDWISSTATKLGEWVVNLPSNVASIWNNFWGRTFPSIGDWIVKAATSLRTWALDLPSKFAGWVGNIFRFITGSFSAGFNSTQSGKKKNSGGRILRRASGGDVPGVVPGQGNGDTVSALLTPGEFVLRKQVVAKVGEENLARLNSGMVPFAKMLQEAASSQSNTSDGNSTLRLASGGKVFGQKIVHKHSAVAKTVGLAVASNTATNTQQVASNPAASQNSVTNNSSVTESEPVVIQTLNVNNPVPERASDSLAKTVRKMGYRKN